MENQWYKNVVVYAVDVKSFFDSNGDGIGDFNGLRSKLGYLSELGITCLWLLPFYPSPLRDNGYDVSDYFTVDPRLGKFEDFQQFIKAASERGINVVIDLVMNHTSDQHPWFLAARRDPKSMFRDYYVWSEVPPPNDPLDAPAFPDSEHGVWHFDEIANAYFYHKFYHFQPDLHVAHTKVQEEIHKVLDFWFSFGISGVRLDAVPIMIKKKGLEKTRPLNSHDIFCQMRKSVTTRRKGAVVMGEVDVDGNELIDYFAEGQGLHLVFNFLLNAYLIGAIAQERAETLIRGWRELPIIPDSGTWLNFLRNLDELNIVQLPISERNKVYGLLAPQEEMRLYGRGIRRRFAPMLENNVQRLEMCYSLLFSLPGTPMIVYGDEIGMGDNLDLWEREAVRTPMQWTAGPNAGFSTAPAESLYRPLVKDPSFHYSKINVQSQLKDEQSMFNRIKQLVHVRKKHLEIGHGRLGWVTANHPSVLAHICHWKNDMLLAVHNLSGEKLNVVLDLKTFYAKKLEVVLGKIEFTSMQDGQYQMALNPYEYGWFSVHYGKDG